MNRQEILNTMDAAAKEDRVRFFKVADALSLQPKYLDKEKEIELLKQQFRDMTTIPNYPDIDWPLKLPEWFPKVSFASNWAQGKYIEEFLVRCNRYKK